jgi:hypothetical protein
MSTLGPVGGVGARDSGEPTINAKKHRWWITWEVPELEIQEHSPSTLRTAGPLGGGARDPGAPTINARIIDCGPPWVAITEIHERPPSMQEISTAGPQAPMGGGSVSIQHPKGVL